jgi:hypothetical protein
MFAVHRAGKPFVDLDELEIDGIRVRSMSQPELYQRLLDKDVPGISPSAGRDSLCELYSDWLLCGDDDESA